MAGDERFERPARAHGAQLAVIADDDRPGASGLHCAEQSPEVPVGRHAGFVQDQDVPWCEPFPAVAQAPGCEATVRDATPAPWPSALAAWPEVAAPMTR